MDSLGFYAPVLRILSRAADFLSTRGGVVFAQRVGVGG